MNRIFNARYPQGHLNYPRSIDEEIAAMKAVTLNDVKQFHKEFYGASTGSVAIVGDFDEKETTKALAQEFGNWRSSKPYTRIPGGFVDVAPVNRSIETPDKANATFLARMNIKIGDGDPDYPAFELANFILGGGFMNSRLTTRIRHKDGLSYGVGSGFNASSFEQTGTFSGSAIYSPENVAKLEAAFKDEIQRAIQEGFTDDEVEKAKVGYLLDLQCSRESDSGIARLMVDGMIANRTFQWNRDFESKVQVLTPQQVNAALRKYLNYDRIAIIKAGDFNKKPAN